MVSVISTTTKFEGYRRKESWLAPEEVVKAINAAKDISIALAYIGDSNDLEAISLFFNPAILIRKAVDIEVGGLALSNVRASWANSILISSEDVSELALSDPDRDFHNDRRFAVGNKWPLTTHQFRRSLSYYASSSGFVSLPTLKSQYKHMSMQMARYYRNGFENIKSIFGFYDESVGDFVLPSSHVAYEFQLGMSLSTVSQLLLEVFSEVGSIFGGTGSYMEKQKIKYSQDGVCVEDLRVDTLRKVDGGEISYRPTLLGGCTKVGPCDSYLLGDYVSCVTCDGAIIKKDKHQSAIVLVESELTLHSEGTLEHQIVSNDLEALLKLDKSLKRKKKKEGA
jgi:hypothetical protein